MAFENANEFSELVIGDTVGIRVANGVLEFKTLTFNGVGYTETGDASFPINETKRNGWNDFLGSAGAAAKGNSAPVATSYGVHVLEKWAIGDSKTFVFHILHEFKETTKIYPHIHWRAMTASPNTAHKVQFDITWSKGKSYAQEAYTANVTFSLLDNPTGFNFNEIIEAIEAQAFFADIDDVITITVKRVTPSAGTSYSGDVVLDYLDLHFESDMILTNERNAPFTKANV